MTAPFHAGQHVLVTPPMTPLVRHEGQILRRARYGWRVRFVAWGMQITETMPESALTALEN